MQLIECPWCGPREEIEFHYGGQAHIPYPADPAALSDQEWAHYIFFRDNTKGRVGRTVEPQPRLPPLVQRPPRHRHLPLRERLPPRRSQAGDPVTTSTPETFRTPDGGRIDRGTTLEFTFNGQRCTGHPGDTLASALLAAGRHQITTSIKLGRPRGITAAWAEDPCGLVQIEQPYPEPMVLATTIELYDGLVAHGIPGQGRLSRTRTPPATTPCTTTSTCWSSAPDPPG